MSVWIFPMEDYWGFKLYSLLLLIFFQNYIVRGQCIWRVIIIKYIQHTVSYVIYLYNSSTKDFQFNDAHFCYIILISLYFKPFKSISYCYWSVNAKVIDRLVERFEQECYSYHVSQVHNLFVERLISSQMEIAFGSKNEEYINFIIYHFDFDSLCWVFFAMW